eukprot:463696-Pelagomonas_calceolata.AAC.1
MEMLMVYGSRNAAEPKYECPYQCMRTFHILLDKCCVCMQPRALKSLELASQGVYARTGMRVFVHIHPRAGLLPAYASALGWPAQGKFVHNMLEAQFTQLHLLPSLLLLLIADALELGSFQLSLPVMILNRCHPGSQVPKSHQALKTLPIFK